MEISDLLDALRLEPTGEGTYRAGNLPTPGAVVFGGQMLAQSIVAGAAADPAKEVKSISSLFVRAGQLDQPLDVETEVMSAGRSFASATVTVRQGDRLCARSLVLLSSPEPHFIRHQETAPIDSGPDAAVPHPHASPAWEIKTVGGADVSDPTSTGPAELAVWSRFPHAPHDQATSRALLAYASEGFLIGVAMRPHPGAGQALAHISIDTSVVSHSVVFHEPFDGGDWLLMSLVSPYAGGGRAYGRGHVHTIDGRMVATISQESMIRAMPDRQ